MRSTKERLRDILECAERIEKFVGRPPSFEQFLSNAMMQAAVLYQLVIIGEAVHHLPPAMVTRYPQADWGGIDAMRNFIVHAYHHVDLRLVWTTATQEVPAFRKVVEYVLNEMQDDDP